MVEFVLEGNRFYTGKAEPALYIVATPIGNLSDISLRAIKTLAGCDIIACEDTRVTGKLLKHFSIKTPLLPYHEHNAARSGPKIISLLEQKKSVALVSDAGTPLVSDPGYRLLKSVREIDCPVIPVPGPSAPLAALVASGMPTDSFLFAGFLPSKTKALESRLHQLDAYPDTLIMFESPNRLLSCLQSMIRVFGPQRRITVARELTKLHEEIISGSLSEVYEALEQRSIKGEIVLVVEGSVQEHEIDTEQLLEELLETMSVSRAATEAAQLTGNAKRELYQQALKIVEDKKASRNGTSQNPDE